MKRNLRLVVSRPEVPVLGACWSVDRAGASRVREGGAGSGWSGGALPTLTNREWLEARFPTADRLAQARGLQAALRKLAAGQARLELAVGAGLEALHGRFDLRELGHSNLDALCTGRLGFSASHGRELRKLSRRLADLPQLRAAFEAGLVPRTRVREIADIATPEDEAGWLQLALRLTSRRLKERVRAVRRARAADSRCPCGCTPAADEEREDERVRVSWVASGADRVTWGFALAMLRQVSGRRGPHAVLAELLAAEVLSEFGPAEVGGEEADGAAGGCVRSGGTSPRASYRTARKPRAAVPSPRRVLKRLRRALARAEAEHPVVALPPLPDFESVDVAGEVLDGLLGCVRLLTGIESERARLLSWMQGRALHRELGHRGFHDWLERDLGLGPRDARGLIELQSRIALLPSLERVWQSGELTTWQCRQLSQVASFDTQDEWIAYARTVTPKLLDAAIENWRVAERRPFAPLPPWGRPLRQLLLDWQGHFGLRRRRALRVVEGACAPGEAVGDAVPSSSGGSGPWRLGRVGFSAPPSVARLWQEACAAVRASVGTVLSDADVVHHMLEHLIAVHCTEEVLREARRHRAIERDGWTCQMPHCRSNGPFHEHHRKFRSAGGSDELSNLVTLCVGCHAMLHAGHAVILGEAPDDLVFLLGTARERYEGERRVEPLTGERSGSQCA